MAKRSLSACPDGLEAANKALTGKGWSKEDLAARVEIESRTRTTTGIGIQTVKKFFGGKSLDRKYFVGICRALDLDWGTIAGLTPIHEPDADDAPVDIEAIVQNVRAKVKANITERCGTMRVLDMTHPIELTDIYTDFNILEKITGRRRLGRAELLQNFTLEDFDRFTLGCIQEKRIPGLEAVEQHRKLMILGKPGAGKTTFLKRLATLCNQEKFQKGNVPIFVTLKDFAEAKGQPDLLQYITQQFSNCGVEKAAIATETILTQGRSLILLDGLDEVRDRDHDRVLQEIKGFYTRFHDCQFVMTCRIAAREYTFERFVEVEVADFDDEQIKEFVTKWFDIQQDPVKAETFLAKLEDNEPIKELATNPLLLTLLCLVFGDAADFPRNRARLYKEGLDVLLKKWDAKRNIERDQVYRKLSLQRKEDLLGQIAFETFDRSEYFFEQHALEQQIKAYIQNLPEVSTDPEALQLDSETVLKSIEAQHGLLIERAKGIYSFSHLTFQEYFTASYILSPDPEALARRLQTLATHVIEKRWREIFLLVPGMTGNANYFMTSIKAQVDKLLAKDNKLQEFLCWLSAKQSSVEAPYKPAAIRAFYFALARDRDLDRDRDRDLASVNPELMKALQTLTEELPNDSSDRDTVKQWWKQNGKAWIEKLRAVMVEHRNIGHDWQFSDEQKERLQQYYDANMLLIECLNSDCYVTNDVRAEIEDTLLLPIAEIEKRKHQ